LLDIISISDSGEAADAAARPESISIREAFIEELPMSYPRRYPLWPMVYQVLSSRFIFKFLI
jgi:hypothetical protein